MITFNENLYFPHPKLFQGEYDIIAAYWDNVDAGKVGSVYYRETGDDNLRNKASVLIQKSFINKTDFNASSLFIATWDGIGYLNRDQRVRCLCATLAV